MELSNIIGIMKEEAKTKMGWLILNVVQLAGWVMVVLWHLDAHSCVCNVA